VKEKVFGKLLGQTDDCKHCQIVPLQNSMQEFALLQRIPPSVLALQALVELPAMIAPPLTPPPSKLIWA
jgi:hypothetical protein